MLIQQVALGDTVSMVRDAGSVDTTTVDKQAEALRLPIHPAVLLYVSLPHSIHLMV